MKSKQDNSATVFVLENTAGETSKPAPQAVFGGLIQIKCGFFEKIPKGITLLSLPHRKRAVKPCRQQTLVNERIEG